MADPMDKVRDLAERAQSEAEQHAAAAAAWQAVAAAAKGITLGAAEPPVEVTIRTEAVLELGALPEFLGDEVLALVVHKLAVATGARAVMKVWDSGRSLSLVLPDGPRLLLRLAAVMSANAGPSGVATWRVVAS